MLSISWIGFLNTRKPSILLSIRQYLTRTRSILYCQSNGYCQYHELVSEMPENHQYFCQYVNTWRARVQYYCQYHELVSEIRENRQYVCQYDNTWRTYIQCYCQHHELVSEIPENHQCFCQYLTRTRSILLSISWIGFRPENRQYCQYVNTWREHVQYYCESNRFW